mmetsp:Transcript_2629/g.4274  ORF Transcript_2629/g.4274 Transcript_2629/m.4274 type:complete len:115 (+) Transcript_2629:2553-2897(+)
MRLPRDGSSDRRTACVLSSSNRVVTVFIAVALTADEVRSDACLAMMSKEMTHLNVIELHIHTNKKSRAKQIFNGATHDSIAFECHWQEWQPKTQTKSSPLHLTQPPEQPQPHPT